MDTKETYRGRGRFSARAKKTRQTDNLRRASKHTQARQEQEARKAKAPSVTYNQPSPFRPKRLAIQLALVAAVVAAILMGVSVFFKVEKVVVYGNEKYDSWSIREASGIANGENLLTFGAARACGAIMDELPYVQDVRISVTLPRTVNIYVTEYEVVYSIEDTTGGWWLISSDGKVVAQTDIGAATAHTQIQGVRLKDPVISQQAVAEEGQSETTTNAAGEVVQLPIITTGDDRLKAAMAVMTSLEKCDVLGQVASIDVSRPGDMKAWYGERFEVLLGDSGQMDKKITWLRDAVAQMASYQNGTLDLTFTTYPNQAAFTPFE